MRSLPALLALTIALGVAPTAHAKGHASAKSAANAASKTAKSEPTAADAHAFVEQMNIDFKAQYLVPTVTEWVAETDITDDTQLLTARAQERWLQWLSAQIGKAKTFEKVPGIEGADKRAIELLKLQTAMPAPKDPAHLTELTTLAAKLTAAYGSGKYCINPQDEKSCRTLDQLEAVLARERDWDRELDAWQGWHQVGRAMLKDYQRFVALLNEGARDLGYKDVGVMWRAGYDMDPAAFAKETDRLWSQVKPLYDELQCYARRKLDAQYPGKLPNDGTIPAHITGNMWAQSWDHIYPLLQPYSDASSPNVDAPLQAERHRAYEKRILAFTGSPTASDLTQIEREADLESAQAIVHRAEDFYRSIGFPALPDSLYARSMLLRPRDRDALCHPSAWTLDLDQDLRIKVCLHPTEEDLFTVYHELGHIYYFLAYNQAPPIFQSGANDGFHEAIGDTIRLNVTPAYLHQIGMVGEVAQDEHAKLNAQMKLAVEKIAFLPFGLIIDKWRWGVFDGSIKPDDYNAAWWKLRRQYQGVSPPVARAADDFDPGAKNHVPTNVPYMRYFLADILQFQMYRALCQAAGHQGPLSNCSIYGNKAAGEKFWAMLKLGQIQPWQQTFKELTGSERMDASAILDYFAPLDAWLKQQNQGQSCGWAG